MGWSVERLFVGFFTSWCLVRLPCTIGTVVFLKVPHDVNGIEHRHDEEETQTEEFLLEWDENLEVECFERDRQDELSSRLCSSVDQR